MSHYSLATMVRSIMGALMLGILIPVMTLLIVRRFMKMDVKNSVALAATYGSVSIVTFGAALASLEEKCIVYDGIHERAGRHHGVPCYYCFVNALENCGEKHVT